MTDLSTHNTLVKHHNTFTTRPQGRKGQEMDELDELNVRIAKALGYRVAVKGLSYATLYEPGNEVPEGHEELDIADYIDSVPDWHNDIAAAWELEAEIPDSEHSTYSALLWKTVRDDCLKSDHANFVFHFAHATPEQRCRAWLAWKEAVRG